MTDIITLPRSVVEQALQSMRLGIAMYPNGGTGALTIQAAIDELRAALEQPQVEQPVAWMWKFEFDEGAAFSTKEPTISICDGVEYVPLYTHPQPKREPLTDGEIDSLAMDKDGLPNSHIEFARLIERAHGIGGKE